MKFPNLILLLFSLFFLGSIYLPLSAQEYIFAANLNTNSISYYSTTNGDYVGEFVKSNSGGLQHPTGITFGPDGNLYVGSSTTFQILRYSGIDGSFIDVFSEDTLMGRPFSLVFGPDENLYVSSGTAHKVFKIDGDTGDILGVAAYHDTLKTPIGLRFGPDKKLYVASAANNQVLKFDSSSGELISIFISDSLSFNSDLIFDGKGNLYVTNAFSSTVSKFDAKTGMLIRNIQIPGKGVPMGLAIGENDHLYVGDFSKNFIFKLNEKNKVFEKFSDKGLSGPENIVVHRINHK